MGSVAAPRGVWRLHGKCGDSMGSVATPWGVWRLHGECPWRLHGECGGSKHGEWDSSMGSVVVQAFVTAYK